MSERADLHTHSNISDGVLDPSEIVRVASRRGLGAIALTDHDTMDGLEEFLNTQPVTDIMLVPGVEISAEYKGHELHLLGYFVDHMSTKLRRKLKSLEIARTKRFPKMLARLDGLGIQIDKDAVDKALKGVTTPGRPHLARILVEDGFAGDTVEAFDRYIGKGRPAYVKKERMSVEEGIRLLLDECAVPVLAHPLTMRNIDHRQLVSELKEMGLVGIEAYYDYSHLHIEGNIDYIRDVAHEFNLVETGGSDFHGDVERSQIGDITVSLDVVTKLKDYSVKSQ